jgi:transposase-like protein
LAEYFTCHVLKQVYTKKQEKMAKNMTKEGKRYVRYSICFKEKVVREVSEGSSISEVCRCYGIKGGDTVQGWIKKFGRKELLNEIVYVKTKGERDELKRLESENRKLKISLCDSLLSQRELERLISTVNARYQTDVRKEFGTLE